MPTLYLIPTPIADDSLEHIPQVVHDTILGLDCYVVEKLRTARRFIRGLIKDFDIDGSDFVELDKRNHLDNDRAIKALLIQGKSIGLMSEAGLPCIADPGSRIVDMARSHDYKIVPLSGPSSIFMALMASGLNGQQFVFHGYLPIKELDLIKKLKLIQSDINKSKYTHICIETPYRNQKLYQALISNLTDRTKLCMAQDISSVNQDIHTHTIQEWKRRASFTLDKRPCIFLMN